jgi:glycosyltransferase involved in cell wall biosynthesis
MSESERVNVPMKKMESSPHLLLVTHWYEPEAGVPQRRWADLIPRLIAAGIDVSVLAPPPHYPAGKLLSQAADVQTGAVTTGRHGEEIVRVRFRPHTQRLRSRSWDQLVAATDSIARGLRHCRAKQRRPQVVLGTVPAIPSMFAAWVLARLLGARCVIEMRDAWPDLIYSSGLLGRTGPRAWFVQLVHRVVSLLLNRADAIVTTTEAFARVLRSRGAKRVVVIRHSTDFGQVTPAVGPLQNRPLRAVYVGTIGRAQGLDVVVHAARAVVERGHPIEVRLVGAGVEGRALQDLATALGAPVTVEPRIPHEGVAALYAGADTAIVCLRDWLPLEWTVPSKLYEVMASGRYITGCVAGEAAGLILGQGAGSVVPPGDVAALADLWSEWAAAGRVPEPDPKALAWVAANADADALAAEYARLIESLARPAAEDPSR